MLILLRRIDFKTKRPTDLEDMIFKLKVDTQYNENAESNDNPRFAVTYGDKISDSAAHVLVLHTQASKLLRITMRLAMVGKQIHQALKR
ncbi:MAG: hypothetical protein CM15mP127_02340 [Gammaproteobacteria bacterium]|nr:MAG: hypothetical protein CM15mP127_02340 [Gammaproteobacteria bacterium]